MVIFLIVLTTAFKTANTILDKLAMQQQVAEKAILQNLLGVEPRKPNCSGDCDGSRFMMPYTKTALASIVSGDKKAAAIEMCNFVKSYCESDAFKAVYLAERNKHKPYNEQPKKVDPDYLANIKTTITEFEASYKAAKTTQEKELFAPLLTDLKRQFKEASDPTPQTSAWREKYPETADSLVAKQLKFYLSELAEVDFGAVLITKQTTSNKEIKVFANPKFEKEKSKTWKYIFRAGKEVNAVVNLL